MCGWAEESFFLVRHIVVLSLVVQCSCVPLSVHKRMGKSSVMCVFPPPCVNPVMSDMGGQCLSFS